MKNTENKARDLLQSSPTPANSSPASSNDDDDNQQHPSNDNHHKDVFVLRRASPAGAVGALGASEEPPPVSLGTSSFDDTVKPLPNMTEAEAEVLVQRLEADLLQHEEDKEKEKEKDDSSSLSQALSSSPLPHNFLLQCLRSRSGIYEEALMVARNFLAFRRSAGWPLRLKASDVSGGPLESGAHWVLPGRDKEGRGLFVFNVGKIDTRKGSLERHQMMGAYLVERFTREESIQKTGIVMIADVSHVSFHLYRALVSLTDARRGIHMWQNAFPCKLKKIYVVGGSTFLLQAVRLVVAMLGKKLRNRIRVLPHLEALQKDIPAEELPPSLGGTLTETDFSWGKWVEDVVKAEKEGKDFDPVWR